MNMPAQPTCTCMLSLHTVPESYSYSYLVLTPYLWITHPLVASGRRDRIASPGSVPQKRNCCLIENVPVASCCTECPFICSTRAASASPRRCLGGRAVSLDVADLEETEEQQV
jgi:hypothetical protein